MPLALILAATLAPATPAAAERRAARPSQYRVDRSLGEADRLAELRMDVSAALDRGEIDRETAARFYYGIERVRRQMIRMGIQVGYRQRVRLRERVDWLYARWAQQRSAIAAKVRSEK